MPIVLTFSGRHCKYRISKSDYYPRITTCWIQTLWSIGGFALNMSIFSHFLLFDRSPYLLHFHALFLAPYLLLYLLRLLPLSVLCLSLSHTTVMPRVVVPVLFLSLQICGSICLLSLSVRRTQPLLGSGRCCATPLVLFEDGVLTTTRYVLGPARPRASFTLRRVSRTGTFFATVSCIGVTACVWQ